MFYVVLFQSFQKVTRVVFSTSDIWRWGKKIMQCYLAKKFASGWCITDDLAAVSHLTLYSAVLIVTFSDCVASDVIGKICSDYLKRNE